MQDEFASADDLHLKTWQKECDRSINAWDIDVAIFQNTTTCVRALQTGDSPCTGENTHAVEGANAIGNGLYRHVIRIVNDGAVQSLWLTGIRVLQTAVDYADLSTVPFSGSAHEDVQVGPGGSLVNGVTTTGAVLGQYIYLRFEVRANSPTDPVELINVGKHLIEEIIHDPIILAPSRRHIILYDGGWRVGQDRSQTIEAADFVLT